MQFRIPLLLALKPSLLSSICVFYILLFTPAHAIKPYSPKLIDPFTESWRWQHIEMLDGVGLVSLAQSKDGHIWLGLTDGLLRYDGTNWQHLNPEEHLTRVHSILAARDGDIYIRTRTSVLKYTNDKWKHLTGVTDDRKALIESADGSIWTLDETKLIQIKNDITTVYSMDGHIYEDLAIDKNENLWLVSYRTGDLHVYPIQNETVRVDTVRKIPYPQKESGPFNNYSIAITDECIWVSSTRAFYGLRCYNPSLNQWREIDLEKQGSDNAHYDIFVDRDKQLWVLSEYAISVYSDGKWKIYNSPKYDLPGDNYRVYQTSDGAIWLGGQYSKIQRIDYAHAKWSPSFEGLHFQCESPLGTRWFIDTAGNVVINNVADNSWNIFEESDNIINQASAVFLSSDNTVWASGSHNDQAAVAYYDGTGWQRDIHAQISEAFGPYATYEALDGEVVFVSQYRRNLDRDPPRHGGIVRYKKNNGNYHYQRSALPFKLNKATSITQQQDGSSWIIQGHQVYRSKDGQHERISNPRELVLSRNRDIVSAKDDRIWIASERNGIFSFDGSNWRRYTTKDGLPSNIVSSLLPLDDGSLIAATAQGISRFDGQTWTSIVSEVLPLQSKDSLVKIDRSNGLWINFSYRNWYRNPLRSINLAEGDASIFKTIRYGIDRTPPDTIIDDYNAEISARGFNYVFWSGHDTWSYSGNRHLSFSYRLNGGAWSAFSAEQKHLFGDLPQGRYTLEVRARDSDFNIDPTPAVARFTVVPPWWQQNWFYSAVLTAVSIITLLIILLIRVRERHLVEMDEMKMSFFTNISHELRTPLTLILGPLETLLEKDEFKSQRKTLSLMHRNVTRLMNLLTQLLDFRKLETGKMELTESAADIVKHCADIAEILKTLAKQKDIDYEVNIPSHGYHTYFDADKLEKIINNLITNAIKYTPKQGLVKIDIDIEKASDTHSGIAKLKIIIEDSGIGINKKHIKHIFDQFYRANSSNARIDGTGIGLSLAKQLVDLCGGKIDVVSPVQQNKGTRFTLQLPLKQAAQPVRPGIEETAEENILPIDIAPMEDEEQPALILIIEDDPDSLEFIQEGVKADYRVATANNGKTGLAIAHEILPDLIITDIIMPSMSGFELCRHLKTNQITSHIPIIMLTGRESSKAQLEGLETGADDYIIKPFQMSILLARVKNLLHSRQKLREQYSKQILLQPRKIAISSADEQFLKKAIAVVESHISDHEFTVEEFASEMNLKRKTLYAKIKALTNQSVQVFIRTIRLERGMQLLQGSKLSVSEVASEVGFLDLSYFSHCFKKHFGANPTHIEDQNRNAITSPE